MSSSAGAGAAAAAATREPDRLRARRDELAAAAASSGASAHAVHAHGPNCNAPVPAEGKARESTYDMVSVDNALFIVLRHTVSGLSAPPSASSSSSSSSADAKAAAGGAASKGAATAGAAAAAAAAGAGGGGGVETVSLDDALERVLAEDVVAHEPFPPFRASVMDGYAVVAADGAGIFPVLRDITAGASDAADFKIRSGTVAYITTGAPVPDGADAVVQVEHTALVPGAPDQVKILTAPSGPGQFIRPIGCDMTRGETILRAGDRLGAAEIGVLAAVGQCDVRVVRRVRVGVMSTGDELVEPNVSTTKGAQIRDSNRAMLLAAVRAAVGGSATAVDLGIVSDKENELERRVRAALDTCDILVLSGGVSMGSRDLVKPLLTRLGTVHFGRLNMKPGKPTTFATVPWPLPTAAKAAAATATPTTTTTVSAGAATTGAGTADAKLVFALPGNPVSALVSFHLLAEPAVRKRAGLCGGAAAGLTTPTGVVDDSVYHHPKVSVRLAHDFVADPSRPEYHRVTLHTDGGGVLHAVSTGPQHSSRLLSARSVHALVIVPAASTLSTGAGGSAAVIARGNTLPALLIGRLPNTPLPAPYTPAVAGTAAAAVSASPVVGPQSPALFIHSAPGGGHSEHACPHGHDHGHQHHASNQDPTPAASARPAALAASAPAAAPPPPPPVSCVLRVGVLTCSDRCSSGMAEDLSGPAAVHALEALNTHPATVKAGVRFVVTQRAVVPDDLKTIAATLVRWSDDDSGSPLPPPPPAAATAGTTAAAASAPQPAAAGSSAPAADSFCQLIVTTGGTGFTARDVTPEATKSVIEREAAGVVTAMLHAVLPRVPSAMLSRAVCGIRHRTLIVNLPGSPKAVGEYLSVLFPTLTHGIKLLQNPHDSH